MFGLELISVTMLVIGAVVSFVLGFVWYSPALFGNRWMKLMNVTFDENQSMIPCMIGGFCIGLLKAYGIAWFIEHTQAFTLVEAVKMMTVLVVTFVGAQSLNAFLWEKRPLELIAINVGNVFVTCVAIAAVFVYMLG